MKVVPKLALALFAGVFVVVAVFTVLRVRSEIELFDQDARRDQRIVGLTAGAALSKTRTREEAVRLARRVDASRELIRVRFVSLSTDAPRELRPLVPLSPADLLTPGTSKQVVKARAHGGEAADLLVTYVGAPVVDEPNGAIELAQPLASWREHAWRGAVSALASGLAMLLVGAGAMALIGARVVGQPVSELIHATRGIAEGDFDVLNSIRRRDEFGELAGALRAMSQELEAERLRTQSEADARIQALEQLRHAERLTTLGQLASVLAHEIGTPLNVIAGHGKLIAGGRLDKSGVAESATTIGEQSERITAIVRRVLDYARRRPPRRASVDAGDILRQASAFVGGLAEQRQVSLEAIVPSDPVELFADPDQLKQIVINLALNAIHASPAGEVVQLKVETTDRSTDGVIQELVALSVHDRGPGIAMDVRERIFEPFYTTKPAGEGTGLGLSIVRDIVEEHGGWVNVSSAVGTGSSFTVFLPRSSNLGG